MIDFSIKSFAIKYLCFAIWHMKLEMDSISFSFKNCSGSYFQSYDIVECEKSFHQITVFYKNNRKIYLISFENKFLLLSAFKSVAFL